jgi:O-antigen/teichoic acid export membrane protein
VAVIASVAAMRWRLGFRVDVRTRGTRLREQARFSLASYLSALLNLVPLLVLPSIALQDLGPDGAADYFMAFQIANMLNTAGHSIASAMFTEVSHDPARMSESLRRSARLMTIVVIPASAVVILGGGLLLAAFGPDYARDGRTVLSILAGGSIAVAFNTWSSYAVQLAGRLRVLVVSNAVFAVVTIGLAAYWGRRGLPWLGWAWVAGNVLSGLVAVVYVPRRAAAAAAEPVPGATDDTIWTMPPLGSMPEIPFDDAATVTLVFPWIAPMRARERERSTMAVRPRPSPPRVGVPADSERAW